MSGKFCAEISFLNILSQLTQLDLGCGWGEFINTIDAKKKFAMDLNPEAADHLDSSVTFLQQDCSANWGLESNSLDVVFSSNFLEHLPSKAHLRETFKQIQRCLKPGGKVICLGPNIRFLRGRYWDFFDHYVALSELSLKELMEISGFKCEECVPRFLPYTMSDRQPPLLFLKLYLKMPLAWPLFGKQFLVVGKKSG